MKRQLFPLSPSSVRWLPGLLLAALLLAGPRLLRAADGRPFASPQEAVDALKSAVDAGDTNTLHAIFGPSAQGLVSVDVVEAASERQLFMDRIKKKVNVASQSDSKATLELGDDNWPFPIPLVKQNGQWMFDSEAGEEEILNRRIGANELGVIRVCRAYVQAQREYGSMARNGDRVIEYAQHLRSTAGTHDGLYWSTKNGDEQSPLGPLIAAAHVEGYRHETKALADDQSPYHGYYFKILTRQGRNAPGGRYNYVINGHMVGGFALVAWPAEWGNTGVMTFVVNQGGDVYQKNLGPATTSKAGSMKSFDPDSSWNIVKDE